MDQKIAVGVDLFFFFKHLVSLRPCLIQHSTRTPFIGLMNKASDFELEDCAFESHRGRSFFYFLQTSSDFKTIFNTAVGPYTFHCPYTRPRGLMDKASDFESEDCAFESRRGRSFTFSRFIICM